MKGTQEEAAEAYDIAAIKFRGLNAVTNFDMSRYDVKSIANSNLPIGGGATTAARTKTFPSDSASDNGSRRSEEQVQVISSASNSLIFSKPLKQYDQNHHNQNQSVDYWSSVMGYQVAAAAMNNSNTVKNTILESSYPYQSCSSMTAMDFSSTASTGFINNIHGNLGYIQVQAQEESNSSSSTNSSSNSIPFATPINGYEVSAGYSSWAAATAAAAATASDVPSSLHSLIQTPIFGME